MSILIASYPRSGRTYLRSVLSVSLSKPVDFLHLHEHAQRVGLQEYDKIIYLVRNPIDSISSIVAMELESVKVKNIEISLTRRITEYVSFYSFALKNKGFFICFDDIVSKTKKTVDRISLISGIEVLNYDRIDGAYDSVFDTKSQNFLKTSKSSELYDSVRSHVMNADLKKCFVLYQIAKKKCEQIE